MDAGPGAACRKDRSAAVLIEAAAVGGQTRRNLEESYCSYLYGRGSRLDESNELVHAVHGCRPRSMCVVGV